jgi:hypothetical protein
VKAGPSVVPHGEEGSPGISCISVIDLGVAVCWVPMESEFAAAVDSWNAFYSAVAGTAATLVGLHFVSLALNPTVMGDERPAGPRVWAGQTVHNFLMVLVMALVALIPGETPEAMAITVGNVGGTGLFRVASNALKARTDPDPR